MHEFEYIAPKSIDEAIAVITTRNESARILAGGTDLVVKMREGLLKPGLIVDGKTIPELNNMEISENGLTVGAAVTCRRFYEDPRVAGEYPALVDSTSLIGGIQIQGRASLGGNLCNAAPSADIVPSLITMGAIAEVQGPEGARQIAVEDFCTGPGKTVLADDEILIALHIPKPESNSGAGFLRFIPRKEMDIAVVNAAASVVLSETGDKIDSARIAIGAVGPTPIFVREAGEELSGKPITNETIQSAAYIARQSARPINDMRGTIEQRNHLVEVLTKRTLEIAINRARG